MKSSVTKAFRKQLEELPLVIQKQASRAYTLWQSDPYHPSLQFKRVSTNQPIYLCGSASAIEHLGCDRAIYSLVLDRLARGI